MFDGHSICINLIYFAIILRMYSKHVGKAHPYIYKYTCTRAVPTLYRFSIGLDKKIYFCIIYFRIIHNTMAYDKCIFMVRFDRPTQKIYVRLRIIVFLDHGPNIAVCNLTSLIYLARYVIDSDLICSFVITYFSKQGLESNFNAFMKAYIKRC